MYINALNNDSWDNMASLKQKICQLLNKQEI